MNRNISHAQIKEPILEYILREIRFLKAQNYIHPKSVVADLGCGFNGYFLKRISKKIKLGIGYDISVAKESLPKNILLKKFDINKGVKIKSGYFDVVLVLAVLEHVKNPKTFIVNVRKMLKSGGKVIITTPHENGKFILEVILYKLGLVSRDEIDDHKNYFNKGSLSGLLTKSGFKVTNIESFGIAWLNILCVAEKTN